MIIIGYDTAGVLIVTSICSTVFGKYSGQRGIIGYFSSTCTAQTLYSYMTLSCHNIHY